MTKVFLSWSGDLSNKVAQELRDWIPCVLQAAKPYFTPDDIEKGARWSTDIAKELDESSIGVICLTAENVERPWIMFEAGALSKKLAKSLVCPILFGIDPAEVRGPLVQFQAAAFTRKEIFKLIDTINAQCEGQQLQQNVLQSVFEKWWPDLEKKVHDAIAHHKTGGSGKTKTRPERDLLEEILELTRRNYAKTPFLGRPHIPRGLANDLDAAYSALKKLGLDEISEAAEAMRRLEIATSYVRKHTRMPDDDEKSEPPTKSD